MAGETLISSPETPFAIPAKIHLFEEWLETKQESIVDNEKDGEEKVSVQVDKNFF